MPFPSASRSRSDRSSSLVCAGALLLLVAASGCFHRTPRPEPPAPSLYMLEAGSRIRVTSPLLGTTPRIGHFIAVRGDTLSMRGDRTLDSLAIPFASIRQLEVSTAHASRSMLGVQAGGVAGFAAGALAGSVCKSRKKECGSGGWRTALALGGGAAGAGVGYLVGQRMSRERWTAVPLYPTIRSQPQPAR